MITLWGEKKATKLNLTKDFCNSYKDLCNVFLKLKWTIKSIGEKKGRKSVFVIRLLSIKGNLVLSKHLQVAVKQAPIVQSPLLLFNGPGSMNSLEHIFEAEKIICIQDNQMTKLPSFVWKFNRIDNSQYLLIPPQPAVLTPTVRRTWCPLTEEKDPKSIRLYSDSHLYQQKLEITTWVHRVVPGMGRDAQNQRWCLQVLCLTHFCQCPRANTAE